MNAKVLLFRDNVGTPTRREARAGYVKLSSRLEIRRGMQLEKPPREVLVAVWRVNPASGRPECRWTTERSTATDEGVSRNGHLRQAA
jgi:hypothetical protein